MTDWSTIHIGNEQLVTGYIHQRGVSNKTQDLNSRVKSGILESDFKAASAQGTIRLATEKAPTSNNKSSAHVT